jgi:hypothetical protein
MLAVYTTGRLFYARMSCLLRTLFKSEASSSAEMKSGM